MRIGKWMGLIVKVRVHNRHAINNVAMVKETDIRIIQCEYRYGNYPYDSSGTLRHDGRSMMLQK